MQRRQIPADTRLKESVLAGSVETLKNTTTPMSWCGSLNTLDGWSSIKSSMIELFEGKYATGADYCAYVLRGEGGHLYNGSEIGATEEQIEAFFDIYETGIAEGWACDPAIYAERTIGTPEQMPLVYGSSPSTMSWCSFTWSNALSALQNAAGDNFTIEMTTWPSKDPKTSDYLKPSMFFCITADSTQPGRLPSC
mgnify:FL=1